MAARVMDVRSRNRALLARQLLLERVLLSPTRAVERLVGLQAQSPRSPYPALWSRLRDFDPMTLSRAIATRKAVRIALMRSTIHLVTARDALLLRPLMAPIVMRELATPTLRRPLAGVDLDAVAVEARRLLEAQPRTPGELGAALAESFPGREPRALAHAARSLLPLVQIPPRGLWDGTGAPSLTTAAHWLGRPSAAGKRAAGNPDTHGSLASSLSAADPSWDDVALRYLRAFGPATAADLVAWCKITGLAEVIARLRPRLRVLHDERGRELFDMPRAPRPPADVPAPPRFLPDYDNVLLAHADRNHVIADAHRTAIWSSNGVLPGTLLVDGFVAATWRIERDGGTARLHVRPLDDIDPGQHEPIRAEGDRLLGLLAPDADHRDVTLTMD